MAVYNPPTSIRSGKTVIPASLHASRGGLGGQDGPIGGGWPVPMTGYIISEMGFVHVA